MLRSLFSGISGLRAHQQMMDVTGNNIANVNTTGFKASQCIFEDTLSQMVKSATAPRTQIGGTNPAQVGLGVRTATITTNFVQGSAQSTGSNTDLMVSGDGFFVLSDGDSMLFSRAGSFSFDANGRLVNPGGLIVQGWAGASGAVDTNVPPGDVQLPVGTLLHPIETRNVTISGNLPADSTSTNPVTQSITSYDAQGNKIILKATWQPVPAVAPATVTQWTVSLSDGILAHNVPAETIDFSERVGPPATTLGSTPVPSFVTFPLLDALGNPRPELDPVTGLPPIDPITGLPVVDPITGLAPTLSIKIDISGVTDYAGAATIAAQSQDGSAMGSLSGFTISKDGLVIGTFSNGLKETLAQIALANFNNATGLEKVGDSLYAADVNSGLPQLGQPGSGGRGTLLSGSLEMSNVDLGQEFTNLIIAQRGFQANSKIISASDELLQDLVNLKR